MNTHKQKLISANDAKTLLKELSGGKKVPFTAYAQGDSMWPFIKKKDRITMVPISSDINIGDIVTFYSSQLSKFVAHRVIGIKGHQIVTKGDNCSQSDSIIHQNDISGRVIKIKRASKSIRFGLGREGFLIAVLSRLKLLTIPARLLRKSKSTLIKSLV